jgi:outer membrane protein OmpA-like peptidoglycan-associated protein
MHEGKNILPSRAALLFLAFGMLGTVAIAQDVKTKGIIKSRSGDTLILQTDTAPELKVQLTDSTDVGQLQGALKARNKKMSMAALVPGLPIQVEGNYGPEHEIVAQKIRFKGNDFQQAQAIQAGMHEQEKLNEAQQEDLARKQAELDAHKAQLDEHNQKIAANKAAVEANKAAIAANTARFGQLDDYYIYDEVTVYFGNGKTALDPKYNAPLAALAKKAEAVNGYMVEVKGFASTSGSTALNQKLSQQRASNVVNYLQQQSHVPLSRMLAPGAMGESGGQEGTTTKDEAEARKVVVRVLQNKAIAGIS